jgi:enterochelin esterase-like enzyme
MRWGLELWRIVSGIRPGILSAASPLLSTHRYGTSAAQSALDPARIPDLLAGLRIGCGLALAGCLASSACTRGPAENSGSSTSGSAAPIEVRSLPPDAGTAARGAQAGALQPLAARELAWRFEAGPLGPMDVVIALPPALSSAARFPVLVAFHGRGESFKSSRRGARGWLDDYLLERAGARLARPPLAATDFEGYVSTARLEQLNAALRAQPFGGVIVVCPYLPDALQGDAAWSEGRALADFLVDSVLPRVYAKTPALGNPTSTGVDGVSTGGRAALVVGFARPEAFGGAEVERFAAAGASALARNPRLALRLLTSDEDYFASPNRALAAALRQRAVAFTLLVVSGTHSYQFNRGPGALEMLLFHDRALRGLPAP